jgi:hypothetical protein
MFVWDLQQQKGIVLHVALLTVLIACDAGATADPAQWQPQLLSMPLPPPEHVQPAGSYFTHFNGQPNSSCNGESRGRKATHAAISQQPCSTVRDHSNSAAGPTAGHRQPGAPLGSCSHSNRVHVHTTSTSDGAAAAGVSMATSLTEQCSREGSSVLTTAVSPARSWQQTLARLKQLQQSAEEVLLHSPS